MVWLKVVTNQEKLGQVHRCCEVNYGIVQVQVCLREQFWLRLTMWSPSGPAGVLLDLLGPA